MPGHRKDSSRRRGEFADNHSRRRAQFVHAIRIGLRDSQAGIDPRLIGLYRRTVASQCGVTRYRTEERTDCGEESPPDFPTVFRKTPPLLDYAI